MANSTITLIPSLVLGTGLLLILALLMKWGLQSISLPSMVGFLALGIMLTWVNSQWTLFDQDAESVLDFLGAIGVIVLLFRVGIESNIHELLQQLPKAATIWVSDMLMNGVPSFLIMHYLLGYDIIPSLFIAVALTATSVGVSVAVWEETDNIDTGDGGLLLDTAELDDISGVAFMALLFAIAPSLQGIVGDGLADKSGIGMVVLSTGGWIVLKLIVFIGIIVLFGKYLEKPLSHFAGKFKSKPTVLVLVFGLGLLIAGSAGLAGLSLPVGALFSGFLFSRHRQNYGIEPFYQSLYVLFVPFFFIKIGYKIDPALLTGVLGIGFVLVLVAILGKILGIALSAWRYTSFTGVLLIGASMVPRAEITMVVIERGRQLGEWAVPEELYAAMVLVSAVTCLGATLFLHWALRKWGKSLKK